IRFETPGEVERPRSRGRGQANAVVPIDRARPEWLKVRLPMGPEYEKLRRLMRAKELHTVCEEAHCPNMSECWGAGTATFMILGDTCTRSCGFCAVKTGRPGVVDLDEPVRVGEAVAQMALGHAVVTSVNRDELLLTMRDIRAQGTDVVTIGQYLRPSPVHLPIERYWTPAEFLELRDEGLAMGYRHVESGPLVRSSYHAERHVPRAETPV